MEKEGFFTAHHPHAKAWDNPGIAGVSFRNWYAYVVGDLNVMNSPIRKTVIHS